MVELTDQQLDAADERGRNMLDTEPRAMTARFDRSTARVVVDLVNGCSYAFPPTLVQDLEGASDSDLAKIVVDRSGLNLSWPSLDVDLYVPALLAGIFGNRDWMAREFARRAGRRTSEVKAAASRANGAKGGRPRKSA